MRPDSLHLDQFMYIFRLNGLVHNGPGALLLFLYSLSTGLWYRAKLLANPLARIIQMRNFRKGSDPFANECYILFGKNISLRCCCRRVINKFAASPRPTPQDTQQQQLYATALYKCIYYKIYFSSPLSLHLPTYLSVSLVLSKIINSRTLSLRSCFGLGFGSRFRSVLPLQLLLRYITPLISCPTRN